MESGGVDYWTIPRSPVRFDFASGLGGGKQEGRSRFTISNGSSSIADTKGNQSSGIGPATTTPSLLWSFKQPSVRAALNVRY